MGVDATESGYEPNWESLKRYRVPAWYEDAKFGIFLHWGVYSVAAFGTGSEWYPHWMYRKGSPDYEHHKATWGDPSEFGYKDFIPLFKAENWDPDAWAELFEKAGARYVVPVTDYHDGFAMYDSSHTRWSVAQMGPKRDTAGELAEAVRKRGMRFGNSSHLAFNWHFFPKDDDLDTRDPEAVGLYAEDHAQGECPNQAFIDLWYAKTVDIIDKYRPDVFWFDFGFNRPEFEEARKRLAAYYYNKAMEWGKGVALNYKMEAFPDGAAVLDIERGKLDDIRELFWQTDTSVSRKSWGYIENDDLKSVSDLVGDLVDIVSKNGCLLLNVGPRADGTISQEVQDILLGIGEWLQVNGEAIYDTRPWRIFGEGPTEVHTGDMTDNRNESFTAQDIRFTTKGDALYATCLAWPEEGNVDIASLGKASLSGIEIADVAMLGTSESLEWHQDEGHLRIAAPSEKPCGHAFVYKIILRGNGFGGLRLTQPSENTVAASVLVENYGASEAKHPLRLTVDGDIAASQAAVIAPGTRERIAIEYTFPRAGLYTLVVADEDWATAAQEITVPYMPLSGEWRCWLHEEPGWREPDFDDSHWQVETLPAPWNIRNASEEEQTHRWYRRNLQIPKEWEGMALLLPLKMQGTSFNGELLEPVGNRHPSSEATTAERRMLVVPQALIRYGAENTLAVEYRYPRLGQYRVAIGTSGAIRCIESRE